MTTKIINIDLAHLENSENDIKYAAEVIRSGGLVAFPTETVYGLGGDGTNPHAARAIYAAKGRPSDNPLIIHIADPHDAEAYTYTSDVYYKLAERFMPGPLTVVLKAKDSVPMETRGGLSTVAVRCPSHPVANRLIALSGRPIAAPSANLSGSPSPTAASHVIDDMQGRIDVIINGGDCEIGLESTIVKLEDDGALTLLRPGRITVDELACIAPVAIADAVTDRLAEGAVALSPGMKYRHYAPESPLVLLDGEVESVIDYINAEKLHNAAIICYTEQESIIKVAIPTAHIFVLGASDDISEQAKKLFAILREADKHNFSKIYAPLPSREGVGLALYNRMIRAAAHTVINLRQDNNG
ncbi:MAG: threonylcarbamoyl-AMP synthase [Clostridia bacterium]|nr:threonylcarbamoyl-AMP synthase [Clostridia bacterium]